MPSNTYLDGKAAEWNGLRAETPIANLIEAARKAAGESALAAALAPFGATVSGMTMTGGRGRDADIRAVLIRLAEGGTASPSPVPDVAVDEAAQADDPLAALENAVQAPPPLGPVGRRALACAARGWRIFPITPDNKFPPLIKGWGKNASNDEAQVRAWWTQWPRANIGVACGPSGLALVDADAKAEPRNGLANLATLELVHGALPATLMAETPSGGRHYYFTGELACTQGALAAGIDTKGVGANHGGYVLAPGSVITAGFDVHGKAKTPGEYRWADPLEDGTGPIAAVPPWVVVLAGQRSERAAVDQAPVVELDRPDNTHRVEKYLKQEAAPAVEGEGGDLQTLRVASRCKDMGVSREGCFRLMREHYNPRCSPPWTEGSLEAPEQQTLAAKVANAFGYCHNEPPGVATADAMFPDEPPEVPDAADVVGNLQRQVGVLDYVMADTLKAEATEWLWADRIPACEYTVFAGHPGEGKTTVLMDIAARITRGDATWPNDEGPVPHGAVIILAAEDHLTQSVIPHLKAAHADMSHIAIIKTVKREGAADRMFDLTQDLPKLAAMIDGLRAKGLNVRLVILDPITACFGDSESHAGVKVRNLLTPMRDLAEAKRVAIIGNDHFKKGEERSVLHMVTDSQAKTAIARAVWLFGPEKAEGELTGRKLFAQGKNNLAPSKGGLIYEIKTAWISSEGEDIRTSRIEWCGPTAVTAQEMVSQHYGEESKLALAQRALEGAIEPGASLMKSEILRRFPAHKENTLRRAAKGLGFKFEREGFGPGGDSRWTRPFMLETDDGDEAIYHRSH